MLFALVVMAGVLLLVAVFNNRREPSRGDGRLPHRERRRPADGSVWAFSGDSGADCGVDGGGGCDGGGGGRRRLAERPPEPLVLLPLQVA
jgi:uncharacterized membrane protein YgcG